MQGLDEFAPVERGIPQGQMYDDDHGQTAQCGELDRQVQRARGAQNGRQPPDRRPEHGQYPESDPGISERRPRDETARQRRGAQQQRPRACALTQRHQTDRRRADHTDEGDQQGQQTRDRDDQGRG
ncbi:MAG: hypothetical protein MZV65_51210 [Chromatiales bacterium]|nr:hypothetical protein [Chromatiales bacterium]